MNISKNNIAKLLFNITLRCVKPINEIVLLFDIFNAVCGGTFKNGQAQSF